MGRLIDSRDIGRYKYSTKVLFWQGFLESERLILNHEGNEQLRLRRGQPTEQRGRGELYLESVLVLTMLAYDILDDLN